MTFTAAGLVRAVRDVVTENPDFVYVKHPIRGCVYWGDKGECHCLIGHGLGRVGVTRDDLPGMYWHGSVQRILKCLHEAGFVEEPLPRFSEEFLWLMTVQAFQDELFPWGECVAAADRMYPNVQETQGNHPARVEEVAGDR